MARKKPLTQDEQIAYEQSRQETIEAVKKQLKDLENGNIFP